MFSEKHLEEKLLGAPGLDMSLELQPVLSPVFSSLRWGQEWDKELGRLLSALHIGEGNTWIMSIVISFGEVPKALSQEPQALPECGSE